MAHGVTRPDAKRLRPSARTHPAPAPARNLTVVVLDDERPIRTLVRLLLKQAGGIEVAAEVASAHAAVSVVRDLQPDLVLVDIDLPGADGLTVVPGIAAAAPDATVVVMSALTALDHAEQAWQGGAFAYLEKTRLVRGLAADLIELHRLHERARRGEDVWADSRLSRVLR